MSDTDEYAAFTLSEFTEEDFSQIDAAVALGNPSVPRPGGGDPSIAIELEDFSTRNASAADIGKVRNEGLSPFQRYRPGKVLSVTDLVSPAWCEFQFDYGLRQKRSRPLANRPKSFLSAAGKEIFVEKAVAAKNDKTTKQGKAIHKELEREMGFEELQVKITTQEERWALRLVNMLACLKCLLAEGLTREVPVFGIINDQVVVGIIDEVIRTPVIQTEPSPHPKRVLDANRISPKSKRLRTMSPPPPRAQTDEFFTGGSADLKDPELDLQTPSPSLASQLSPHRFTLHLNDTKTRRTNSIPPHEDTLPSRLQLMLYHQLLTDLIATSQPFNFSLLWKKMELRPFEAFSSSFLVQAGLLSGSQDFPSTCLNDLAKAWNIMVQKLDVSGIDRTLQLVYRLQTQSTKGKRRQKSKFPDTTSTWEAQDLAKAIEASLESAAFEISPQMSDSQVRSETGDIDLAEDLDLQWAVQQSLLPKNDGVSGGTAGGRYQPPLEGRPGTSSVPLIVDEAESPFTAPPNHLSIIGTKEFTFDEHFLNVHLVDVLQWWHGTRQPKGVSLEQSRRCSWCEYCSDCEWRAQKALELSERGR